MTQAAIDASLAFELVLRGIALGGLAASAVAFLRSGASFSVRIAGVLFCLNAAAYVLNSSPYIREAIPLVWHLPVLLLSWGGGGYFWLFVYTLFEDRRITMLSLAPAAVLTGIGIVGFAIGLPQSYAAWITHNLLQIVAALFALFIIYRSWRGDLVEARRRLRGPFMAVVGLFLIVISSLEIGEALGVQAAWYSLAGATALAVLCLLGAFTFLEARAALFGAAEPAEAEGEVETLPDPVVVAILAKLKAAMDEAQVWRREGITIGELAQELGMPEHRLRRLINDHLGHRNFTSFVNAHRIEAAKQMLSDPAHGRTTIAAIAFELGFGSLGPFNRAFKDATGVTPTEWRRQPGRPQRAENGSPIPEIPG
jgi:AraC-like DNA-binding protein